MAITFSGLATGLDTDSIVKQIMEIERAPIDRLTARKNSATERLNAFFQLKGRLDALKTAASEMSLTSQVRTSKATLSSEGIFTATTNGAATGSYDVAVAQLAQVQKTVSEGFTDNASAIFGSGTITVNGTDITVDASNNSVLGLADSINAVSDKTGVRASVINGGGTTPYHLVFTGKDATTSFSIASNLQDGSGAPISFTTTQAKAAQQAVAFIDGIKVISNSNTIDGAINGVTLNLTAQSTTTSPGVPEANTDPWDWQFPPVYQTTRMDIAADTGALKEKITSFVTAYNGVIEFINSGYEEFGGGTLLEDTATKDNSGSSATAKSEEKLLGTVLRGDATVNSVKRQLQAILTDSVKTSGAFSILSEIGISTQKDGSLKQNNSKLDKVLSTNFNDVASLLSGEGQVDGVMKRFNSALLNMTSLSSGVYATQKKNYQLSSTNIDKQISVMEDRMTKREATLRAQFSAMEDLVSTMNSQSQFLAQQLSNLTKKD